MRHRTGCRLRRPLPGLAAALLVSMAACLDVDLGLSDFEMFGPTGPFGYSVTVDGNILRGDTIRAWSFENTRWSVWGPAEFVRNPADTLPGTSILIRGTGRGAVTVMGAQACCQGSSASTSFQVGDSADVSLAFLPDTFMLRLGSGYALPTNVQDTVGRRYRSMIEWTSSDTTVAVIAASTPYYAAAMPRRQGTTWFVATWSTQRDSVQVAVTP